MYCPCREAFHRHGYRSKRWRLNYHSLHNVYIISVALYDPLNRRAGRGKRHARTEDVDNPSDLRNVRFRIITPIRGYSIGR